MRTPGLLIRWTPLLFLAWATWRAAGWLPAIPVVASVVIGQRRPTKASAQRLEVFVAAGLLGVAHLLDAPWWALLAAFGYTVVLIAVAGVSGDKVLVSALVAFDHLRYPEAVDAGTRAAQDGERRRRYVDGAMGWMVCARAQVMLGRPKDAAESVTRGLELLGKTRAPEADVVGVQLHFIEGELRATRSDLAGSTRAFRTAIEAATRLRQRVGGFGMNLTAETDHYRDQAALSLAWLDMLRGHLAEAAAGCDSVLEAAGQRQDLPVFIAAAATRAGLHHSVDERDDARHCIDAVMTLAGDERHREVILTNTHVAHLVKILALTAFEVAKIRAADGDYDLLVEELTTLREMGEAAHALNVVQATSTLLADVALVRDDATEALRHLSVALRQPFTDPLADLQARQVEAAALHADGQVDRAVSAADEMVALLPTIGAPEVAADGYGLAADIAARSGHPTIAVTRVREAVRNLHLLSGHVGRLGRRRGLLANKQSTFARLMQILTASATASQAGLAGIEVAEAQREDTLVGVLSATKAAMPPRLREVADRADEVRHTLAHATESARAGRLGGIDVLTGKLRDEHAALTGQLSELIGGTFAELYVPTPITGTDLLDRCGQDGLLSLTVTDSGVTGYAGHLVCRVPGELPQIQEFQLTGAAATTVDQLRSGSATGSAESARAFGDLWAVARHDLAETLLPEQLRKWLRAGPGDPAGRHRLIICADGPLRTMPFAALPLTDRTALISHATVNRLPLLRLIGGHATEPSPRPALLGYFHPELAGAQRERQLLKTMHDSGEVDLTVAGSRGELLDQLATGRHEVLVLATHGRGHGLEFEFQFHSERGISSARLLTARIPRTVLAPACYSGADAGSDATGMIAACLAAGATEVLSGLWRLPDGPTGRLMSHIYRGLPSGAALRDIAAAAPAAAGVDPTRTNPLAWAGLMVTDRKSGLPAPAEESRQKVHLRRSAEAT
ncbi:CHAT domain-containing protein [Micromonospora sp. 15K316]|uniref:CHAT domain-containing protein n=1 Tax=Micromonospora sp. 15K316 TaxID=2530376 RepID=UPI001049A464|nr:CHAT domain-containing protein [Micromonospora sp. 15K316]TDC40651.1 CHAT domain-containing protein [Micromonospora sp. 15K316]